MSSNKIITVQNREYTYYPESGCNIGALISTKSSIIWTISCVLFHFCRGTSRWAIDGNLEWDEPTGRPKKNPGIWLDESACDVSMAAVYNGDATAIQRSTQYGRRY